MILTGMMRAFGLFGEKRPFRLTAIARRWQKEYNKKEEPHETIPLYNIL